MYGSPTQDSKPEPVNTVYGAPGLQIPSSLDESGKLEPRSGDQTLSEDAPNETSTEINITDQPGLLPDVKQVRNLTSEMQMLDVLYGLSNPEPALDDLPEPEMNLDQDIFPGIKYPETSNETGGQGKNRTCSSLNKHQYEQPTAQDWHLNVLNQSM